MQHQVVWRWIISLGTTDGHCPGSLGSTALNWERFSHWPWIASFLAPLPSQVHKEFLLSGLCLHPAVGRSSWLPLSCAQAVWRLVRQASPSPPLSTLRCVLCHACLQILHRSRGFQQLLPAVLQIFVLHPAGPFRLHHRHNRGPLSCHVDPRDLPFPRGIVRKARERVHAAVSFGVRHVLLLHVRTCAPWKIRHVAIDVSRTGSWPCRWCTRHSCRLVRTKRMRRKREETRRWKRLTKRRGCTCSAHRIAQSRVRQDERCSVRHRSAHGLGTRRIRHVARFHHVSRHVNHQRGTRQVRERVTSIVICTAAMKCCKRRKRNA